MDALSVVEPDPPAVAPDLGAVPPAGGTTAVVLDLPGDLGVWAAVYLAAYGYRPVPLYNAVPFPTWFRAAFQWPAEAAEPPAEGPPYARSQVAVCDLVPILSALYFATPNLGRCRIAPDAPPAFMLDAQRSVGTVSPQPGLFDNRSISLPTDFPSANRLQSHGLRRIVLVQHFSLSPKPDLSHTLLRYQQAGMEIAAVTLEEPAELKPIAVARPPLFRKLWHRFQATIGFRRHPLGGFGGTLPMESTGGGG
jgi:hypothetical protein